MVFTPSSSCWTIAATARSVGSTRAITPSTTCSRGTITRLPELLGGGTGYEVRSEGEFDHALRQALADRSGFSLIHVHLDANDASQALERLAKRLRSKV